MQPESVAYPPVDPASAPILPDDWAILNNVETAVAQGHDLLKWWADNRDTRVQRRRHPVARQIHRPDQNYGFLMDADLRLGSLPVAGVVQDQLFSFPKQRPGAPPDLNRQQEQLRTFVMRHLLRCLSSLAPQSFGASGGQDLDGWQYRQVYYRLNNSNLIGKFSDAGSQNLISLDEVGKKYAWIVFHCVMHRMEVPIDLAGTSSGPRLTISMTQPVYGVMTPQFLMDEQDPEPGVIARYGYGNSIVPNPNRKTLLATGPSWLHNAIEMLHFRLLETGEIRASSEFIMPKPVGIIKMNLGGDNGLPLDPVFMALRLAGILTLGLSQDEFAMSRESVTKALMSAHFSDIVATFNMLGSHFGMVADWKDTPNLPDWTRNES